MWLRRNQRAGDILDPLEHQVRPKRPQRPWRRKTPRHRAACDAGGTRGIDVADFVTDLRSSPRR